VDRRRWIKSTTASTNAQAPGGSPRRRTSCHVVRLRASSPENSDGHIDQGKTANSMGDACGHRLIALDLTSADPCGYKNSDEQRELHRDLHVVHTAIAHLCQPN